MSGHGDFQVYVDSPLAVEATGIFLQSDRSCFDDERSINLGSVYESVVASELAAHGHKLFYYDNRNKGKVDYLIDDYI